MKNIFNKKLLIMSIVLSSTIISALIVRESMLSVQFGISSYAAKKIIDIVSGAGSVWAIIAVVGVTAGWGAALMAGAKWAIKHFGKAAAVSW